MTYTLTLELRTICTCTIQTRVVRDLIAGLFDDQVQGVREFALLKFCAHIKRMNEENQ